MTDETRAQPDLRPAALPRSPMEHRVMFVVFALLSFAMFAPVVMLPIIREHCELLVEEARLLERTATLQTELSRRVVMLDAFENDAVVNERLAMLDLHYRKPGEAVLTILPNQFHAEGAAVASTEPVFQSVLKIPSDWPAPVRRAEAWAQRYGLIDLFLNPDVRPAFLLMSGGLLIAAFVLFAPRVPREKPDKSRARVLPPRTLAVAPGRTA
jgi:hypothetical protein